MKQFSKEEIIAETGAVGHMQAYAVGVWRLAEIKLQSDLTGRHYKEVWCDGRAFAEWAHAAPVSQGEPATYRLSETDIYDFAGWLTTRPGLMSVGSSSEAGPMAEAVGEYVRKFPERFAPSPAPAPQPVSEPSDADIDAATSAARDALMDHVSEYGTIAEGQQRYIRQIARAVLALRPAAPRAPLTEEQVAAMFEKAGGGFLSLREASVIYARGLRDGERAHGIGQGGA